MLNNNTKHEWRYDKAIGGWGYFGKWNEEMCAEWSNWIEYNEK